MAELTLNSTQTSLYQLEKELSKKIGPAVLDYDFVFAKKATRQIQPKKLDDKTVKLIADYVLEANHKIKLFFNKEIQIRKGQELDSLMDALHEIYMIRYLQAKSLFAEYELVRIPTRLEIQLWEASDRLVALPSYSFRINIPEGLEIDEYGNLDIEKTIFNEKTNNTIKKYLCAVPESEYRKVDIYKALYSRTTRANALNVCENEITDLCKTIAQEILMYTSARIYYYIERGYTPEEGKRNISGMLMNMTATDNWGQNPELQPLIASLQSIFKKGLEETQILKEDTIKDLLNELVETLGYLFSIEKLLPINFYQIDFREPDHENPHEKYLHTIIDSSVLLDDGQVTPYPIESYDIDLSIEAKTMIFDHVTGGLINPAFKLDNYLYNYPDVN